MESYDATRPTSESAFQSLATPMSVTRNRKRSLQYTAKLATMMERLMESIESLENQHAPQEKGHGSTTKHRLTLQPTQRKRWVVLSTPRAHCLKLSGSFVNQTNGKAARKLLPFGVESPSPEGPVTAAHSTAVYLCPVSPVGGYKLSG